MAGVATKLCSFLVVRLSHDNLMLATAVPAGQIGLKAQPSLTVRIGQDLLPNLLPACSQPATPAEPAACEGPSSKRTLCNRGLVLPGGSAWLRTCSSTAVTVLAISPSHGLPATQRCEKRHHAQLTHGSWPLGCPLGASGRARLQGTTGWTAGPVQQQGPAGRGGGPRQRRRMSA